MTAAWLPLPRRQLRHPLDRQLGPRMPTVAGTVLADRETGTLYLLGHDTSTDQLVLTTPVPSSVSRLPAEPVLLAPLLRQSGVTRGRGSVRLYALNGELTYELVQGGNADARVQSGAVFTLNVDDRTTTYRVHADNLTAFGAALCLDKYTAFGSGTVIEELACNAMVTTEVSVYEDGVYEPGVYE